MIVTVLIESVTSTGKAIRVRGRTGAGQPVAAELPYVPGENEKACCARVRRTLAEILGEMDRQRRETIWRLVPESLQGMELAFEKPWGPVFLRLELEGRLLRGQMGEPQQSCLLVIREPDGSRRDLVITPGRSGFFSVDLGEGRRALALTPVGADGLLGDDIILGE